MADTPSKKLNQRLGETLDSGELTDIVFRFNNLSVSDEAKQEERQPDITCPATIGAHKMILALGSSVFKAMFYGPLAEQDSVAISDVSPATFKKMLEFIYTDSTELTGDNVMEVLYIAKKYDVTGLMEACVQKIYDMLTRDTAVTIYPQASLFGEEKLAKKCLEVIDKNAHYVINTNSIVKDMDRDLFAALLKRDTFCAREVDIWDAMIWWARQKLPGDKHDFDEVRTYLGDLLYLIRFSQMTPKELLDIVLPTKMLKGDEVLEALHYAFPKRKRGECTKMFPVGVRSLNQEIVVKASQLPLDPDCLGGKYRMERVADRGFRSIRFRVDHRIFLKKITLTNVPNRVSGDRMIVTVKVIDCVLSEIVSYYEFNLTRNQGYPPTAANYKLDLDPVELCPKITYEVNVSVENRDNPETKIVKAVGEDKAHATVRFLYYGRVFSEELVVDELYFST
ncbi:BTB/POZ domain-containing protein 1 [Halotydeus destructor]|nr:BTB/POZ domain-containing protein 1 [Halotydeus destructor]